MMLYARVFFSVLINIALTAEDEWETDPKVIIGGEETKKS